MKWEWNFGRKKPAEPDAKPATPEQLEQIALMGIIARPRPERREEETEVEDAPPNEEEKQNARGKYSGKYLPRGTRAQNLWSQALEVTTMTNNFIPLEDVRVATPCRADWDKMQGDDRARFCGSCTKHVYNLSEMTCEDVERLILEHEGHLCVRFYQRADGTMLTKNCPVGITQRRRPFWALTAGFAALMASGVAILNGANAHAAAPAPSPTWRNAMEQWRDVPLIGAIMNKINPPVMGDMVCVLPPTTPSTAPTPTPAPTIALPSRPHIMGRFQVPKEKHDE